MNCTCGHELDYHTEKGCEKIVDFSTFVFCKCDLSKAEALLAAQRAAACKHLKELGEIAKKNKYQGDYLIQAVIPIFYAISAFRAVGILKSGKE